jgi:predicted nucleic acid-binding protein
MKNMELKSTKKYALDTNILVYLGVNDEKYSTAAKTLFSEFKQNKIKPYIPDKCLYEYYSVITNLEKLGKITHNQAKKNLDHFIDSASTIILSQTDYTHYLVRDLLEHKKVAGRHIHDVVVISILLENQIDCIITQNKKDFEGILGLEVISLEDIA